MQLRDLRELAEGRGFEVVREYIDTGISGAADSRPALNGLLADARRGRFKAVLVWKLDRLGRSLVHLVQLLEDLRQLDVELISFSEGLDFTTTTGKLLYQVISAFVEFERDCIRRAGSCGPRLPAGLLAEMESGTESPRSTDSPLLAAVIVADKQARALVPKFPRTSYHLLERSRMG